MSLRGTLIPEYNPALPDDQKEKVTQDALKSIATGLAQTGANLLLAEVLATAQAVTSAALILVPFFSRAIVTSGGLLEVEFKTFADITGGTAVIQLLIDGVPVDTLTVSADSLVLLMYKANLPAGEHKIGIQASISGGATLTLGPTGCNSGIWATEMLL